MFYIHQSACISSQQTFLEVDLEQLKPSVDNKLSAIEPVYENIPPGLLRRMGKAVRMGVGTALPLTKQAPAVHGIVIGTANGGMEDCIKFLNQIIDYEEGRLTPTNFVQSTTNAVASQIGLLSSNKGYNVTHVHRGLAFENAMLDVTMLLQENPGHTYLLGGLDEISAYNYNIDYWAGWFKKEPLSNEQLLEVDSPGSMAGEGSAMFLVNREKSGAESQVLALDTFHSKEAWMVESRLKRFLATHLPAGESIDLYFSGDNGDNRFRHFYTACEALMGEGVTVAHYKHLMGEYATVSAAAVWLASRILQTQVLPRTLVKVHSASKSFQRILLYNHYQGFQHSFILLGLA